MLISLPIRFSFVAGGLLLAWWPAQAQKAPALLPSFYATYAYMAYTVYDTSADLPTQVRGVGGSLTLRPTGTYEKRFSISGTNGPMLFWQDGTFVLSGDSIRFAFTDAKGPDVQRGTFQYDSTTRHLTLTILGYPTGNKGVYELIAAVPQPLPPLPAPAPAPPTRPGKKRRR